MSARPPSVHSFLLLLPGVLACARWNADAIAARPPAAPLPPGALVRLGDTHFRHRGCANQVAVMPGGKVVLSGGTDGCLRFWDIATGAELRHIGPRTAIAYDGNFHRMALSPDGKVVALGGWCLRLINVETGEDLQVPHMDVDAGPVFTHDSKMVMYSAKGAIRWFDIAAGKERRSFPVQTNPRAFARSPDGEVLATGDDSGTVRLWNIAERKELHRLKGHKKWVAALAFSPDGKTVASGGGGGEVILWNAAEGKQQARLFEKLEGNDFLSAIAFSPDGRFLATTGFASPVRVWHVPSGKLVRRGEGHQGLVESAVFAPDGQTLWTASRDGTVRGWALALAELKGDPKGWRPAPARELHPHRGHVSGPPRIDFAPDGRTILTRGHDQTVRRWDAATGRELSVRPMLADPQLAETVCSSITHPDGRTLIVVCRGGTIHRCDVATGRELRRGTAPSPLPNRLAISPGGRTLALAGTDNHHISLYDVETLTELRRWNAHHDGITDLTFATGGRLLVSGSFDNTTRIWDVANGEEIQELEDPASRIPAGYSHGEKMRRRELIANLPIPDGRTVLAGGLGGEFVLLDICSGRPRARVTDWSGCARVCSPDGWYLALTARECILLREMASGQEVARLTSDQGFVHELRFSPDGRTLASAGDSGTVVLWDVTGCRKGPKLPAVELSAGELDRQWKALADADAAAANLALWMLVAAPRQSVSLLRERLRPVAATNDEVIGKLASRLGAADAEERARAEAELEQRGTRAEGVLHKIVAGNPPASVRRSAKRLLEDMKGFARTPALRRSLRAVHVLEQIAQGPADGRATREAAELLAKLAGGEASAPQTRAAGDARARLAKPGDRAVVEPSPAVKPSPKEGAPSPPATVQARLPPPEGSRAAVRALAFTPDGRRLVTVDADHRVRTWDPRAGKMLHEHRFLPVQSNSLALSADGRVFAANDASRRGVLLRTTTAGREKEQSFTLENSPNPHPRSIVTAVGLNSGGKRVATAGFGHVRVWDVSGSKPLEVLTGNASQHFTHTILFAPDGRTLAVGGHDSLVLLDGATGRPLPPLCGGFDRWRVPPAFSPDGRSVFAVYGTDRSTHWFKNICQWEVATGRFRAPLIESPADGVTALAVSPDGRTLVSAAADRALAFWDAPTGRPLGHLTGHKGSVQALAFAADGELPASGGEDGTVLVWKVTARPAPAAVILKPEELRALWDDLAGNNARKAYRAVLMLARGGQPVVSFLADHLRPAEGANARRVSNLLADLDSDQFRVREQATQELAKLGEAIGPMLREVLAKRPNLEVRKRVENLLARTQPSRTPPDRLPEVRAVEVLERLDTPAARRLLDQLADGAVGDPLTLAAQDARRRLAAPRH